MKTQQEVFSDINHMMEVLNERILGYRKAAENVKDVSLKEIFQRYALQAEQFQSEIEPFSDKSSSEVGTRAHGDAWRLWMDMKAALTNGSSNAMIGASITGEEAAIRNYEDVLDEDLPADLRSIFTRQLAEIKTAYNHIKSLHS